MKISAARIFVKDIQAAKEFYCNLGLDLEPGVCIFKTGETKFIIEVIPDAAPEHDQILVGRFTGLSFPTNDIYHDYQILKSKGVRFCGAPEQQDWGGCLATLIDPAKMKFSLSKISPNKRLWCQDR